MNHRGVEYSLTRSETRQIWTWQVWTWQFRIGDIARSGKTEARLLLLAMRPRPIGRTPIIPQASIN